MKKYIYQYKNWTDFTWNEKEVQLLLSKVRFLQGKIFGYLSTLGFTIKEQTLLSNLTLDVLKSSEIEGEKLNIDEVRSSIAKKLGIEIAGFVNSNRNVDGVVDMILDATQKFENNLTDERLFNWHGALFPTGRSGLYKIEVAQYRTEEMQIISGPLGKEKVHYQAVAAKNVKTEMDAFLNWLNKNETTDLVLKAAIAHFWFIIIHPFDDGNGRIARAISDYLLAKSENSSDRFYSLSNQILNEKKQYYSILKKEQHSKGDITDWLLWFLNCLYKALQNTEETIKDVLNKTAFWEKHKTTILNSRQRLMLNKLLDGFEGKLKTSKWAKITKSSADTALRDIKDLIEKQILKKEDSGGRSTNYELDLKK